MASSDFTTAKPCPAALQLWHRTRCRLARVGLRVHGPFSGFTRTGPTGGTFLFLYGHGRSGAKVFIMQTVSGAEGFQRRSFVVQTVPGAKSF